ncbi:MAG: hypothetical protein ACJA02_001014 [Myxococcota bacterium]|jgi:hypothetical protein
MKKNDTAAANNIKKLGEFLTGHEMRCEATTREYEESIRSNFSKTTIACVPLDPKIEAYVNCVKTSKQEKEVFIRCDMVHPSSNGTKTISFSSLDIPEREL